MFIVFRVKRSFSFPFFTIRMTYFKLNLVYGHLVRDVHDITAQCQRINLLRPR